MNTPIVTYPKPIDTAVTTDLRETAHETATLGCIALLTFTAGVALSTVPPGHERQDGERALQLAERMASGDPVDPGEIVNAMHYEDEGVMIHQQLAPPGSQAEAWAAVIGALGYAAWNDYMHRGEHPNGLVEGWRSSDALDFCIDPYVELPDLNWTAIGRATAWVRQHASKADEGWGRALKVEDLRRVAHEMIAAE